MGRFYKQTDTNFVNPEDFLFKAPWEEIKAGMKYQDQQIDAVNEAMFKTKTALSQVKYDKENEKERMLLENITGKYEDRMDEFTEGINSDAVGNWRKYKGAMKETALDLQSNLATGELGAMQQRAEDVKNFEATYKGKMDGTFYNTLLANRRNNISSALEEGDFQTKFDNSAVLDRKDLSKAFLEDLRMKKPNIKSISSISNGSMLITTTNGKTETITREEVSDLFHDFAQQPGVKDYMKFTTDNKLESWLDAEGNVDFNGADTKHVLDYVKNLGAYSQTESSKSAQINPAYESALRIQEENNRAANAAKAAEKDHARQVEMMSMKSTADAAASASSAASSVTNVFTPQPYVTTGYTNPGTKLNNEIVEGLPQGAETDYYKAAGQVLAGRGKKFNPTEFSKNPNAYLATLSPAETANIASRLKGTWGKSDPIFGAKIDKIIVRSGMLQNGKMSSTDGSNLIAITGNGNVEEDRKQLIARTGSPATLVAKRGTIYSANDRESSNPQGILRGKNKKPLANVSLGSVFQLDATKKGFKDPDKTTILSNTMRREYNPMYDTDDPNAIKTYVDGIIDGKPVVIELDSGVAGERANVFNK